MEVVAGDLGRNQRRRFAHGVAAGQYSKVLVRVRYWALVIALFSGIEGAFRIVQELQNAHQTQINALKKEDAGRWGTLQAEAHEQRLVKIRNRVADKLRPERDFGLSERQLSESERDLSGVEIEEALRYWEQKGMIRSANGGKWVWISSSLPAVDGWR